MGSRAFKTFAHGKNSREAFDNAIEEARYAYGHREGTGTIAEKERFVTDDLDWEPPEGVTDINALKEAAIAFVEKFFDSNDDYQGINDKWGPAGCIKVADDLYLFFGWAKT